MAFLSILIGFFLTHPSLWARADLLNISPSMMKRLNKGAIISSSKVQTQKGQQSLAMEVLGLHRRPCSLALLKLSLYENYQQYLDLVEKSSYHGPSQNLILALNHPLLPFKMSLHLTIPRIDRPGRYPFHLNRGFLKGLMGHIQVRPEKKRCLLMARADWQGPKGPISDGVFELFTTALSRLAVEKLFVVSRAL